MASEKVRLFLGALLWLVAGATAALAGSSARIWVGAGLLVLVGIVVVWPLARTRAPAFHLSNHRQRRMRDVSQCCRPSSNICRLPRG